MRKYTAASPVLQGVTVITTTTIISNQCDRFILVDHPIDQVRLPVCSSRLGLLQPDKPDEAMAATLVRPLNHLSIKFTEKKHVLLFTSSMSNAIIALSF